MALPYYYDQATASWKLVADFNAPASTDITFSTNNVILGRVTAGAGSGEEIDCTAAGRALLDDATAADQAHTLGLGTADSPTFTAVTASSSGTAGLRSINTAALGSYSGGGMQLLAAHIPSAADQRLGLFWGGAYYQNTDYTYSARIQFWSAEAWSASAAGAYLTFHTNAVGVAPGSAVERMRVAASGNILIGTTTDTAGVRLKVVGGAIATSGGICAGSATTATANGVVEATSKFRAASTDGLASQVVALAKLASGGADGSITITGGIVTAYVAPT